MSLWSLPPETGTATLRVPLRTIKGQKHAGKTGFSKNISFILLPTETLSILDVVTNFPVVEFTVLFYYYFTSFSPV